MDNQQPRRYSLSVSEAGWRDKYDAADHAASKPQRIDSICLDDEIELDEIIRNDDDGIFPNKSEDEHEHDDSLSSLEELVEEKEEPANNGSGFAAQLRKSPDRIWGVVIGISSTLAVVLFVVSILGGALGHPPTSGNELFTISHLWASFGVLVAMSVLSAALSVLAVFACKKHTDRFPQGALLSYAIAFALSLVVLMLLEATWLFVLAIIFLAFFAVYVLFVARKRLSFAFECLELAVKVFQQLPSSRNTWLVLGAVQVAWVIFLTAAMAFGKLLLAKHSVGSFVVVLLWALKLKTLFWTYAVIGNFSYAVTACVTSNWYHASVPAVPTALHTILKRSICSICRGAFILGPIGLANTVLRMLKETVGFMCNIPEPVKPHVSKLNYVQVAVDAKDFTTAGHDTRAVLDKKGMHIIAGDSMMGFLRFVVCLTCGLVCFCIGALFENFALHDYEPSRADAKYKAAAIFYVGFVGYFIGYTLANVVFSTFESIVGTIFVCFAKDPLKMRSAHREEFDQLSAAIKRQFGSRAAAAVTEKVKKAMFSSFV